MGACYSVILVIRLKDEASAVHALKNYISTADNVNFNMEKQRKRGLTTDTFDDLIHIFLSGCDQEVKEIFHATNGTINYEDDFDASYGWHGVMCDMFEKIAPFLKNGSVLKIYDDDLTRLVAQNGKAVYYY